MTTGDPEFDKETADVAVKSELSKFGLVCERLSTELYNQRLKWQAKYDVQHDDFNVFTIRGEPREAAAIHEIARSGNGMIDKSIWALTQLCVECNKLHAEANNSFIPALLLYAEIGDCAKTASTGGQHENEESIVSTMSHFVPCLQELSVFVIRCYKVINNMIHQLSAIYNQQNSDDSSVQRAGVTSSDTGLTFVFQCMAQLLGTLVTLDQVIGAQRLLQSHWEAFMRAVNAVHNNPKKFDMDTGRLRPLENVLQRMNEQLFRGYIYQNCAEQSFAGTEGDDTRVNVSGNGRLAQVCLTVIKSWCTTWTSAAAQSPNDDNDLLGMVSLFGFYTMMFRTTDKKIAKQLWDTHKKLCTFPLVGSHLFTPCQFLWYKVPLMNKCVDLKSYQSLANYLNNQLLHCIASLPKDTAAALIRVNEWSAELGHELGQWQSGVHIDTQLQKRAQLIDRGVFNARSISRCIRTILGGYLVMARTDSTVKLSRSTATFIFTLTELLKHIEEWLTLCGYSVLDTCQKLQQRHTAHMLRTVSQAHDALNTHKQQTNVARVDVLSALVCAEQLLTGPATVTRLMGVQCAVGLANLQSLIRAPEWESFNRTIIKLNTYSQFTDIIKRATDCSYLTWQSSLVKVYMDSAVSDLADTPHRLTLFSRALNDCVKYAGCARHLAPGSSASGLLAAELCNTIQQCINKQLFQSFVAPLCTLTETQLRLFTHTHLQLDNAWQAQGSNADTRLDGFFRLDPLTIGGTIVDIKRHVERYLEKTFYNLTTVALHDWQTYAKMRHLASVKFDLCLVEPHLPSHQLDQGLDVLTIMRKIHVFAENYNYNLNMQCFVEKCTTGKYVNTLSVSHAANSIRTHGHGICNTTVNYAYKFIRQKFYIFSQFLYDDQIRSQLIKDARYFKDNFEQLQAMYPPHRAEKFNRDIRSLGVTPDDLTYLDQFRILCTHIGNALGYVRLIRAGGLEAVAQAIHFVPDLDDIVPVLPLCTSCQFHNGESALSRETLDAAENFDSTVGWLADAFSSQGTEYFKLLVDVFSSEFRNYDKYAHLKNFYVIVPPLIVNFVEHIRACKDRIGKRSLGGEACFSDDGFAMGVAYILKLLDQNEAFDSLHWFKSCDAKYRKDRAAIQAEQTSMSESKLKGEREQSHKFTQAMTLKLTRMKDYHKEMQLVQWAMRSARVFFRSDVMHELIKDKDNDDDTASVKSGSTTTAASRTTKP